MAKAKKKSPAKASSKTSKAKVKTVAKPSKPQKKVVASRPAGKAVKPAAKAAVKGAKPHAAGRAAFPAKATVEEKKPAKLDSKKTSPKKAATPAKGADVDVDMLPEAFGPDELAEYADEVEEATRDEEADGDGSDASAELRTASDGPREDEDSDEIVLTDAEGRKYCRVKDCDQLAVVEGYCRYHYLLLWKRIQVRKKILSEGKLERYVEELTARYPDKYLEMIRKDLKTEKDFVAAIQELEIDDSGSDSEFEDDSQFIEEVRGMSGGASDTTREDDDAF